MYSVNEFFHFMCRCRDPSEIGCHHFTIPSCDCVICYLLISPPYRSDCSDYLDML